MKESFIASMICIASLLLFSCGKKEAADPSGESASPSAAVSSQAGQELGMEILAVYESAAAEVLALVKDKPDAATVKPKILAVIEKHGEKMSELNGKVKALRASDPAQFGQMNSYLGSNRGPKITAVANSMSDPVRYYNFEKGDKEMVELLSSKITAIIETALKM